MVADRKWWRIKMPLRAKGQSREEVDEFHDVIVECLAVQLEATCWTGV